MPLYPYSYGLRIFNTEKSHRLLMGQTQVRAKMETGAQSPVCTAPSPA